MTNAASERDTFLIFHVPSNQSARIRRHIHKQEWYTGWDMPVRNDRGINYLGVNTGDVFAVLENLVSSMRERQRRLAVAPTDPRYHIVRALRREGKHDKANTLIKRIKADEEQHMKEQGK